MSRGHFYKSDSTGISQEETTVEKKRRKKLNSATYITTHQSNCINLIEIPKQYIRDIDTRARLYQKYKMKPFRPLRSKHQMFRRQGLDDVAKQKDNTLKEKIGRLIDQTINDAKKDFYNIQTLRAEYNDTAEYKVGFLMYMVKRSRDVMNELFNVAVKHKDDYKALDQLKILEFIIHTNVDTANLLRQLVDIAVKHKPHLDIPPEVGRLKYALL